MLETIKRTKEAAMSGEAVTFTKSQKNAIRAISDLFLAVVKDIPAVDAVSAVHERWIDRCRGKVCVCSRCDQEFDHTYDAIKDEWLFCPKCGARMDAEEGLDAG